MSSKIRARNLVPAIGQIIEKFQVSTHQRKRRKKKIVKMKAGLYLLLIFAISIANCAEKQETLVLLDSLAIRETHSIFFKSLQGKI